MSGQINRGSILGEYIYNISLQKNVNTIVEIGTWNGQGSTKCILDAVKFSEKNVYSLECNNNRVEEARLFLGQLPINFHIIHGTVVTAEELRGVPLMFETLNKSMHNIDLLNKWLNEDVEWLKITPNVLADIPEKIDLLILDGGAFSGDIEFSKLGPRSRYIILDDTKDLKNENTRKFILNNADRFDIIVDNLSERNGFLICERKNF